MPAQPPALDPGRPAWQALVKGIEEFNAWRFYDCHETLEDVWRDAGGKSSDAALTPLYHGLIKAAAGFHHVLRNNHAGAVTLLSDSLRLLEPFRPSALGIDIEGLTAGVREALAALRSLGPERISEFDRALIPQIAVDQERVRAT